MSSLVRIIIICIFSLVAYHAQSQCDPADAASIDIYAINTSNTDYVVICNNSTEPVSLSGMIMIVDSNPSNVETIGSLMVPSESCVRLVRGVDFDFGLGSGDSFTISCEGTTFASATASGGGLTTFGAPPQSCNAADASSISIRAAFTGNNPDRVTVCNTSSSEVVLSGAVVSDDGGNMSDIPFLTIPANGCVTLLKDLDFDFGLGGDDGFTIACGATTLDSQSWTSADLRPDGSISFGTIPCDPSLAAGSVFISSIVVDSTIIDQVVVCNSSASMVSLDGAEIVDNQPSQVEFLVDLSIEPFSCITLIREVHFSFGLGTEDSFTISCMGNVFDMESWDEDELNSTEAFLFVEAPPVDPLANKIPTMGEWGLISLSLLILIVGAVKLREEKFSVI